MATWNTPPTPTQAKAFLGVSNLNAIFSFNPDEVKWAYKNNTVSRDTIGGRVVQVLSSSVDAMTINGRAGSRERLQVFAKDLKNLMQYHIKTGEPVNFKVPSQNWNFQVYIQNISSLGWDVTSTSYPYELTLMIQEDLNNVIAYQLKQDAFLNLSKGMGYNPELHGGSYAEATQYIEAMKNALGLINFGTSEDSSDFGSGSYNPRETGTGGNKGKADALLKSVGSNLDNVPKISNERFITPEEIYAISYWALKAKGDLTRDALKEAAIMATAISWCESRTHDTQAYNVEGKNAPACGLWQMNEGFGTSLWDPIIAALWMAQEYYQQGWDYWGCGPTASSGRHEYSLFIDDVRAMVG